MNSVYVKITTGMFVNEHNNAWNVYMGSLNSSFLDNLMLVRGVTCMLSARVIKRIGSRSALRKLPPEMFRLVSDFLAKDKDVIKNEMMMMM